MAEGVFEELFLKVPYAWEPEEVERVKQAFRDTRPAVQLPVVSGLWQYWRQRAADVPLFDDPDEDLALLLHAKALGLDVPVPDPDEPLAALLGRAEDPDECGPLMPEALSWGPRAALARQVRAALPGSLVRVWAVVDDQGPVEVLAVGEGLPEIRQQVVQSALMTSLRINGLVDPSSGPQVEDFIGVGLTHVSAGLAGRNSAVRLPSVFDARRAAVLDSAMPTARGLVRELVNGLRALERETNLVEVVEVRRSDVAAFSQTVRELADRAADHPLKAFLRPARVDGATGGVAALLPYLRTTRSGGPGASAHVVLHSDLLSSQAYRDLEEAHQRVLARRLTLDAKLRRDRIEADIKWLTADLKSYERATKEERALKWDPTVLLVEKFDELTGTVIKLAEQEEIDVEVYYATNVPQLVKSREIWRKRLNEVVANLDAAAGKPHAPARQLAASRFLDAVVRDVVPDESPATEAAFLRWRDQVAPMLRYEWRRALRAQGIDPADVFTRHTAFLTRYLPSVEGDEAALFVQPYSVVDEHLSAVLADAQRRVLVVRDTTDHAVPEHDEADTPEARTLAERAWAELARLGEDLATDEKAFNAAFLDALRAHPRHIARRMTEELQPEEPGAAEAEAIEDELRHATQAMSLGEGMDRARKAMRASAFVTARQSLDEVRADPHWEARAWLLRAVVECAAADLVTADIPGMLGSQMPGVPAAALRALDEAMHLDATYTTGWLATLPDVDLDRGIRRLFHGIPRMRASTTDRERAVWLFRGAVEAARLARQLEQAGEELPEDEEAVDTALVKLGKAVEDILVGPYVGGVRNEADSLLEVLTGEEPPKYGGRTGA
ncbi:hypothetical protein [Saccharothrix australiensis]|uniref:Uncharacterized protein n=1 Tax=Saccharothrix australiensis TaxID=2072 RepID=A0A495W3D1_9PSEU|nr:hypothetical protein [Saccharothrix australiensis]RKT55557.1 hypothetical protein C8E97_4233 [Saccharothrix australiensis]